jgi:DNA-binding NarL/FixJ family response regulator
MIDPASAEPVIGRLKAQQPIPPLTDHEQLVLAQVLEGLTNTEIAERMGTDVGLMGTDIAALIRRITSPAPQQGQPTSQDAPGRHRRS